MLDIKFIRANIQQIKNNIINRNINLDLDELLKTDDHRKKLQAKLDDLRSQQNLASQQIAKSEGAEKQKIIQSMQVIADQAKEIKVESDATHSKFNELMEQVPNISHPKTPVGKSDANNVEIEKVGEVRNFNFTPKDHVTLGMSLDLLDFEKGANVVGSKFYYCKNELVQLELALVSFALNLLKGHGFTLITTPDLAKRDMIKASGFNPRDDSDQIYNISNTDLSLIATSEITIGAYHMNETFKDTDLPKKYVGYSHCFRKEAGTYGQESKGLYRVHQFTKIEMYIICLPEDSEIRHLELLEIEKEIFTKLGIPFRIVEICTGDMGVPAYRKYDLEAWMPMKNGYGEITSTSNCTDYQARRLKIKHKSADGQKEFAHTLNGTAIAISRAIIAILENYQQADGSIVIPEVLRPYMGNLILIKR
ncbi:MAG: serine--tRNA ligase [Patescibacteria group bacterium]